MTLPRTTTMTPFVRINHPTHQAYLTGSSPLRHDLQPQLIQTCESGQIRTNKGTVQHVEVSPQGYMRTPITGRPRPQDRHTSHAHTRPTPCFVMSRGNLRWADEQSGMTADWPPRYDDNIWNLGGLFTDGASGKKLLVSAYVRRAMNKPLDVMIRNSQDSEWRGLDLGKQDR